MTDCQYCLQYGKDECKTLLRQQCIQFPITPSDPPMIYPLFAVYALFNFYGYLVYVGKSINLPTRIQQHWHDRNKTFWHWDYIGCETATQQIDIEAALIQRFRPQYNKALPLRNEAADDNQIADAYEWLKQHMLTGEMWRQEYAHFWIELKKRLNGSRSEVA